MSDEKSDEKKLSLWALIGVIGYSFRILWRYSKSMLFMSGGGAIVDGLSPIVQAYLAGAILNELSLIPQGIASRNKLLILVIISSFITAIFYFFGSLRGYMYTAKREAFELELQHELLYKKSTIALEEFEIPAVRDKYERARQGISDLQGLASTSMDVLGAAIAIGGTITVVASTLPWLVIVLIPLPIFSIWMRTKNFLLWRTMWDHGRSHRMRAWGIENMFESVNGIMELRLFNLTKRLLAMWHKESLKAMKIKIKDEKKSTYVSILTEIFETLVAVAVDVWLVFRVFAGVIGLGLFEQTRRLVSAYIAALSRLASSLSGISIDGYRLNDYRTFMSEHSDQHKGLGEPLNEQITSIELMGASFTYPNSTYVALDNVDLVMGVGEHIAIVGENGAGKTTLLKVMLGLFGATEGEVLFNNRNSHDIAISDVHKQVSPLMQDYAEFSFLSVKEAVGVSTLDNIDKLKVKRVLQDVGLLEFVMGLPKGLDTNLGYVEDDGIKLSGGQWQRMAIARALYKEASILVLDEPTSAIDAKSEQDIIDTIFEQYSGKMVIIVSHRISTVKRASKIIMMKNGQIAESGTHKELFHEGTAYYDLFHKQAKAMSQD